MNSLPEARSPSGIILMSIVIQSGALNIGYVLTYLTLSIYTIFANLNIIGSQKTNALSLINGILPLGCTVGVICGYFMKKVLTNKQSMFIADIIGMLNLFTLISKLECLVAFRFFLGIANGISSLIMPLYVKSICPERYFQQVSMILGYGVNTGLMIGQLMGIGYIDINGQGTSYWRVVFFVPSLICLIRSSVIYFFFNYDSPEQLILRGKNEEALYVVKHIYKDEYVEEMLQHYQKQADVISGTHQSFFHIFHKKKLITLQIGVITMMVQMWCGAFAVFYYSAQIFDQLSGGDLKLKTIYTICIGIFSFFAQFATIYLIKPIGSKYLLIIGGVLMGIINIAIGIMSNYKSSNVLFGIFLLMVLLIMVYATTLGPVGWSIVPQINDSDATFFSMATRWGFQTILIFLFPFMVNSIQIEGVFILFGVLDIIYAIYTLIFIIDSRGMTNVNLIQQYQIKYRILPQEMTERQSPTQQL